MLRITRRGQGLLGNFMMDMWDMPVPAKDSQEMQYAEPMETIMDFLLEDYQPVNMWR